MLPLKAHEIDHKQNVEDHVKIWDQIKQSEFGSVHMNVCAEIASSLVICNHYDLLDLFLREVGPVRIQELQYNEKFLRAFITHKLHCQQYREVYTLLEKGRFSSTEGLLDIWDEAHYNEKRAQLRRELTPLIRYRIRQKYPPPMNICPSGKRPSVKLPAHAVSVLKKWLSDHFVSPYPSQSEKEELAATTRLSLYQVKTWFANARRRLKNKGKNKTAKVDNDVRDVQVTSTGSETTPSVSSTSNGKSGARNNTNNALSTKQGVRRESLTPALKSDHQTEPFKRPRLEPPVLPEQQPTPSHIRVSSYPCDWKTPLPARSLFTAQPVLSPSIFELDETHDMNASRSLQALAGMCDNIMPSPSFPQRCPFNATPVPTRVAHCPSTPPTSATPHPDLRPSPVHRRDPQHPEPRSHALWQPFRSTENLPLSVSQSRDLSNTSQNAPVRPGSCSAVSTRNTPLCRGEGSQQLSSQEDGLLSPNALQDNPLYMPPTFVDFFGHPYRLPPQYMPRPSPALMYPLPIQSLPMCTPPLPSGVLPLNINPPPDFQTPVRPGQLSSALGQPWSAENPLPSTDMLCLPYFNGQLFKENSNAPEDSRSDVAQVLLDLSKARSLMSPDPSCRE